MPLRNSLINRLRHGRAWDEWDEGSGPRDGTTPKAPVQAEPAQARSGRRRILVTLTFATLVMALRTWDESSVIAPITASVITARTTPYSAIV